MTDARDLWNMLAALPVFWLTLTLLIWIAATALSRLCRSHPLVNPVLLSIAAIIVLLTLTGTPYPRFFACVQPIHFLLGPTVVALAAPLVTKWSLVSNNLFAMACALLAGSIAGVASIIALGHLAQFSPVVIASIAPKSATAGVAIGISSSHGGDPGLTTACVIATGILGAVTVTPFMNFFRVKDYAARGFAAGLAAHGIGTARAYAVNPTAGLFAGIAMVANAILTSVLVPLLL